MLPPPGMDDVDEERLVHEVLSTIGFAQRLGFATTISPIRVVAENGDYFTGGFVFRSFSVPALTIEQYAQMIGSPFPPAPEEEDFPPADDDEPVPIGITQSMDGDGGEPQSS
jgi:hypothetical protein